MKMREFEKFVGQALREIPLEQQDEFLSKMLDCICQIQQKLRDRVKKNNRTRSSNC